MKGSTAILLALLALSAYLLYRSLDNLGSSLAQLPTAIEGALFGGASTLGTSALSTLGAEGSALNSSLGNPVGLLGSLGTTFSSGLSSLFGSGSGTPTIPSSSLGTNSLYLNDGSWNANPLLTSGLSDSITVPVQGGTLNIPNLPSIDTNGVLPSDGVLPTYSATASGYNPLTNNGPGALDSGSSYSGGYGISGL